MQVLRKETIRPLKQFLREEYLSIIYHDLFDYPLTQSELVKWRLNRETYKLPEKFAIERDGRFYFLKERNGLVLRRKFRELASQKKLEIAKRAAKALSLIPTIKMVAITGALAMKNADEASDIDLMVVTSNKTLWITRLVSWLLLKALGYDIRKPKEKDERDKLCLNMWLDESDLVWDKKKRGVFHAHEIAQIVPLLNKNKTYERFIYKNSWIKKYWPNAVKVDKLPTIKDRIPRKDMNISSRTLLLAFRLFEPIAFKMQYFYMKDKITSEVVTPTKALFHPINWSKIVESRLKFFQ